MSLRARLKAAFDAIADQDRAVLRGWYGGTPFDARNVEARRADPPKEAPGEQLIHQPLHHGSDSPGSVGSLGSIHDTEVRHS